MNLFYEDYPTSVVVNGEEIPIITDFRSYIQLHDMLRDDDITYLEKYAIIMNYFEKPPSDFTEAVEQLMQFVEMRAVPKCGVQHNEEYEAEGRKELYSFSIDYPFIFSAFLHDYGINIRKIPYMHWWEFCALFEGLSDDTEIKQRISYRSVDINQIEDKKERKRIQKIQNMIQLPGKELSDYGIGDAFGW